MHAVKHLLLLAFFSFVLAPAPALALDYPTRPVRIIVGFAAGGSGDIAVRALGNELTKIWKQPVVVENKTGAGGLIAYEAVAKATPDGYTLLQTGAAYAIYHLITKNLHFDPLKDLVTTAMFGENVNVFATNALVPAANYKEFLAYAKANPGKLNYASLGRGFVSLTGQAFKFMTGTEFIEISYKGSPEAITGLIRNDTQLIYNPIQNLKQFIDNGSVRPLFVIAKTRVPELPNVPTNAEVGLEKLTPIAWAGLSAPSGAPRDILFKINADVSSIVSRPDFQVILKKAGMDPLALTLPEIRKMIDDDVARWTAVVKSANIQPE